MFLHAFEVLNQSFDTSCWRLQQAASDNCIQPCAEMCAIIINMATAMDHLWLCVTFECRTCNKSLKFFKKNHPAESCGEIINRCMPDDHIACKIIEIRAQGSGTGSGGSVSCEVDTPSAVLADFGSNFWIFMSGFWAGFNSAQKPWHDEKGTVHACLCHLVVQLQSMSKPGGVMEFFQISPGNSLKCMDIWQRGGVQTLQASPLAWRPIFGKG